MNYRKLSIVLFHYLYLYKNKNRKADLSLFNYARWPHKIRIRLIWALYDIIIFTVRTKLKDLSLRISLN